MSHLNLQPGQTAVITGAASGFGLELARLGAQANPPTFRCKLDGIRQ